MDNQDIEMVRLKVFKNFKTIKLAKDYSGRLYRIVKSEVKIYINDDEYFCFIQRRRGLFWRNIEVIAYDTYLNKINGQSS
ncbi:hypothetical protein [Clostridium sp.]|uniref:hypothetical protein n=1 Tax=Clostridium sp. TaxID=1506 RepID=UPI0026189468|nr:hypothetical protein [uncultured Clostridium sp.]